MALVNSKPPARCKLRSSRRCGISAGVCYRAGVRKDYSEHRIPYFLAHFPLPGNRGSLAPWLPLGGRDYFCRTPDSLCVLRIRCLTWLAVSSSCHTVVSLIKVAVLHTDGDPIMDKRTNPNSNLPHGRSEELSDFPGGPILNSQRKPGPMSQEKPGEKILIDRTNQGDKEAFAKLYAIYKKCVYGAIKGRTNADHDAQEIAQQTRIQVQQRIQTYDPAHTFQAFAKYWASIMRKRYYAAKTKHRRVEQSFSALTRPFSDLDHKEEIGEVISRRSQQRVQSVEEDAILAEDKMILLEPCRVNQSVQAKQTPDVAKTACGKILNSGERSYHSARWEPLRVASKGPQSVGRSLASFDQSIRIVQPS